MVESKFQSQLIKELSKKFEGCMIFKLDPTYKSGSPDLLVLYKDKWAALECKRSANAHKQPLQDYYVDTMNDMSYAAFIYPENKEDIIHDLQQAFGP